MSGRTAAALCLAAFFATAATAPLEWVTATWSALAAAVEEPAYDDSGAEPGGWLIDPNG